MRYYEDSTRVMLRIKALFRARASPTSGVSVYRASQRKERPARLEGGACLRAASPLTQLDLFFGLRPKAKAAMIGAALRPRGLPRMMFVKPCRDLQLP